VTDVLKTNSSYYLSVALIPLQLIISDGLYTFSFFALFSDASHLLLKFRRENFKRVHTIADI
jgi:hypothetical protein